MFPVDTKLHAADKRQQYENAREKHNLIVTSFLVVSGKM